MRPLKVEFQAFGPYSGYECVDFEALSSSGLFLICGDTGTGKTTVLDAITFALYGKSSGGGRDSFEQMRCRNASDETVTFVKLEFENNGDNYVFERRLEKKRVNFHKSFNALKKDSDGNWQVLFENAKESDLNSKAVEIIGLEYSQFVQVIILPQGKFEELLTSNSDDKEKILTSIFGEELFKRIASKVYELADKRKEELSKKKTLIKMRLQEEGCESISELASLIEEKKKKLEELKTEADNSDLGKIIKKNQELLTLVKRFEDLEAEEAKLKRLKENISDREAWIIKINNAKRAEKVRDKIEALMSFEDSLNERKKEKSQREAILDMQKNKFEKAEKSNKDCLFRAKEVDEKKALIAVYEGKLVDYEGINAVLDLLEKTKQQEKQLLDKEVSAKNKCSKLDEVISNLKSEYDALSLEHNTMLNSYLANITGEIAKTLVEGEACPVCGSKSHPKKAKSSLSSVTREQVDNKKEQAEKKYTELTNKTAEKEEAEKEVSKCHAEVETVHSKVVELSVKHDGMKENLVEGIESLADFERTLNNLKRTVSDFEKEKGQIEKEYKLSSENYAKAKENVLNAEEELKKASKKYDESKALLDLAIKENSFASEDEAKEMLLSADEVEELTKKVAEYDAAVKSCEENLCKLNNELNGLQKPDKETCEKTIEEASTAKESFAKEIGILEKELADLTSKEKKISEDSEGIDEMFSEAERDWAMAKKLRGDSGVGLQRYVLGIMFSSVVAEANKKLEYFDNGKYKLYRTNDRNSGSTKSGLELKIVDKYSDDKDGRFVGTLSGGEKFLTSLALAIGMSSVAKKSGIKIDAMFIDEGFGSLDESCIGYAMDILDSVKKASGTVGIISHMPILEERIPTKLIATVKGKEHHIVQSIG